MAARFNLFGQVGEQAEHAAKPGLLRRSILIGHQPGHGAQLGHDVRQGAHVSDDGRIGCEQGAGDGVELADGALDVGKLIVCEFHLWTFCTVVLLAQNQASEESVRQCLALVNPQKY